MSKKTTSTAKKSSASPAKRQQQNLVLTLGISGLAAVVAVIAIMLSGSSSITVEAGFYDDIPQRRAADGAFILGDPDAPITLIEFADFNCPACQQYKPTVHRFVEEFVVNGQAQLEYRTIITVGGEATRYAVQLAECADEIQPNSFWDAYEVLYGLAERRQLTLDVGQTFADEMGLDRGELISCTRTAEQIDVDERLAASLRVTSSPTILVRYGNDASPRPVADRSFDGLKALVAAANQ